MVSIPLIGRSVLSARRTKRSLFGTYAVKQLRHGIICIVAPLSRTKYRLEQEGATDMEEVLYMGVFATMRGEILGSRGIGGSVAILRPMVIMGILWR